MAAFTRQLYHIRHHLNVFTHIPGIFSNTLLKCFSVRQQQQIHESQASIVPVPLALQLAGSTQLVKNGILRRETEGLMNSPGDGTIYTNLFKEQKLQSPKKKREVDAEAEPEGGEEPKEEEAAHETEAVPLSEAEAESAPQPATEDEEENEDGESEKEQEPIPESEPQPDPETAIEEGNNSVQPETTDPTKTAENDESGMLNDAPAQENENEKQDESNASHVEQEESTESANKKNMDKNVLTCFSCKSNEDLKCPKKPTQEVRCPKVSEGDAGKHNGCFTLYQADTNITLRGCVDELAEAGLKYCLTNEKLCNLCYTNSCNNKEAPRDGAVKLQFNNYSLIILTTFFAILTKFASLEFI